MAVEKYQNFQKLDIIGIYYQCGFNADQTSEVYFERVLIMKSYYGFKFSKEIPDTANLAEREKPLMINGVRIQPGCLIFKDAYDGKSFDQTITITNCRKDKVRIRISPPTSKAFKIKPMPIARTLSAGLRIVRHIKYLCTKPIEVLQASMGIFIDNEYVQYQLLVLVCYTQVNVFPKILDFGEIDMGMISKVKKITITNIGTKQAQYATDLGRNQLEIVVDPMKGTIQPSESKELTVEVFGTAQGQFSQEFWIKTEPLQRVQIQGQFIQPMLKVDYPLAAKNFLVLNFPKMFVGVPQHRNVIIQNYSSTSAVFCVNGRTTAGKFPYNHAKKLCVNFKQFEIFPLEGRLRRDQKCIMRFTFTPEKPVNRPNYYICHTVVDAIKCRTDENPCIKPKRLSIEAGTAQLGAMLDNVSATTVTEELAEPSHEIVLFDDMITIIVYGEVELPEITIKPHKVCFNNLKVYETRTESLTILNQSSNLPLLIKYNKAPNVEFEPKTLYLPPNQPVEATLKIRPFNLGKHYIRMGFDVLYQYKTDLLKLKTVYLEVLYCGECTDDMKQIHRRKPSFLPGITPKNCNEVGYLVDDIRFCDRIEKPVAATIERKLLVFNKNNKALIAFPNDRPKIVKPWRNLIPCKTIFAQLPRLITQVDVDYDLSPSQQFLRDTTRSYYTNYIRRFAGNRQSKFMNPEFEDYETTNKKKLLMQHFKNTMHLNPLILKDEKIMRSLFVPLTPYEIHRTIVSPKFIQLGRLAANGYCSNHFNIDNQNDIPIHVSIMSLYDSIEIAQDEFILLPNSQKNIGFVYRSDWSGSHHIPMFIILNFFLTIEVTILAKIVANTVRCIEKSITISPSEKTGFLELRNPINSDIVFTIDTNFFHLESFPTSGIIPAGRNMIVTVTLNPEVGISPVKEIAVISENGYKELVTMHFAHKKASVSISSETLTFSDIPLNTVVTQQLTIVNNSDQWIPLSIQLNGNLIPELTITPMNALIWQKADLVVTFTVKFKEVIKFTVPVELKFEGQYSKNIMLIGNVVNPSISFKPELIKFPKIPSGSTVKAPFRIMNDSEVPNYVSFFMHAYPEFSIKTKQGENLTNTTLTLAPKERRDLLLDFQPHEPVVYCIYLPYILNNIFGPPELNCPESLQPSHYILLTKSKYKTPIKISVDKLETLKIICAASTAWLKFNSLQLNFKSDEQVSQIFEITNISNVSLEVYLKLDNIECFCVSSTDMLLNKQQLESVLEPQDSCVVSVSFYPISYGNLTRELAIYVKSYSETCPYNYLKLVGENPEPELITYPKMIYFPPTFPGSKQSKNVNLELVKHKCDGKIKIENDHVMVIEVLLVQRMINTIQYMVTFNPTEHCIIETEIVFSCPCSMSTKIEIYACCDSAMVINFISDASVFDKSTYPFFPLPNDKSNYATLLRDIMAVIELWLCAQGYYSQHFYRIPEDIARCPVEIEDSKEAARLGKKKRPQLPLVQLLVNLVDKSILQYIECGLAPPQDLNASAFYNYTTYKNTISFLKCQGIHVLGLKPEHLLTYAEYMKVKINYPSVGCFEDFDEDMFYRFSKQKWMDLFFHMYKVLVLERIVNPNPMIHQENETTEFIKKDMEDFNEYLRKNIGRFSSWYICDAKLLLWLEYHYNRQKNILWPNEKFEGIQYFHNISDVKDSVSLATVTAAYCPYLIEYLRDIYVFPKNLEQKVHNACKVVQSWKNLKLSFDVHPQIIIKANSVKIIFIVTYLYEVLPYFYPTEEVIIEAPLTESLSYGLDIQNCGDVTIEYNAIFFGETDCSNLFQLDCSSVSIPSRKTKTLKLTYHAKKVLEVSTILVLTGEAGRQKFAKSKAIAIRGVPKTTSSAEIKLQVEMYKYVRKKLPIKTPYGGNYQANIFICFKEPKSYEDLHAISTLKDQCIPREIDIVATDCEFVNKGEASITLATCFLSQGLCQFYLYFRNGTIGDFCVLVRINTIFPKNKATTIDVQLPQNFNPASCICSKGFNRHCPRNFTINIPAKNQFLCESTETLIRKCFSQSSVNLLKRFFGTPILLRLVKFYLERLPQGFMLPACIFDDQMEFFICNNNKFSSPLSTIKISDVASDQTVRVPLHLSQATCPTEEYLELKSLNEKEIRCYKLVFPGPEQISIPNNELDF